MESMDYTSYFTPAPNTFGYLGFVNDANVPDNHGVSSDSNAPIQVRMFVKFRIGESKLTPELQSMELEQNFEASLSNFMPAVFEYNFDGPVRPNGNASTKGNNAPAILRHDSSSSTASSVLLSGGGNDSLDSGMVLDLDSETALLGQEDRRSNSVDKELLTPAQSRRKAQNRAA